jgi:cell fate regulator YaaT (PSP1 superfamily)
LSNTQAVDIPLVSVAQIKVRDRGVVKKVGARDFTLEDRDRVILEMNEEVTYGVVYGRPQRTPFIPPMRDMKTIIRKANPADLQAIARQERLAGDAMAYWCDLIDMHRTPMKAIEVVPSFDHPKITFMFTADERVDFRVIVKELAGRFRARIQMQQIGARDEAKHLGGVGLCGLVLCCASFLTEFKPITMKMVRAQGLPLDDNKLLGLCGRLKCCLAYEYEEGYRPPTPNIHGQGFPLIQPERLSATN